MQSSTKFSHPGAPNSLMSSLIPEPALVISPHLAATIGLEEAALLSYLGSARHHLQGKTSQGFLWFQLEASTLLQHLPFWCATDIQRVLESLRDKGILLVGSPPLEEAGHLVFAFNQGASIPPSPVAARQPIGSAERRANTLAANWQPDETTLTLLAQRGVPRSFCLDQVAEFAHYWHERGEARHAWGNRFVTHVLREWRQFEQQQIQHHQLNVDQEEENQPALLADNWTPSADALEILEQHAEIPRTFIFEAIPEFVLYWREKGERSNTWNARFINHIKRQWTRYRHALENDNEPRPIAANWKPHPEVFDILSLAHIDTGFAQDRVKEFVIYWLDRKEARPSWNSLFIQHIKQQWQKAHQHPGMQSTRERSILDALTDRSWAD